MMNGQSVVGIVREVIAIAVLWAVGFLIWFGVGADEWRQFLAWSAEPYVDYWRKWGAPFFVHGEGRPWVYAVALGVGALLLLRFVSLSVWLAKVAAGFVLAYVTIYAFT